LAYFPPFWYIVTRKIWQICIQAETIEMIIALAAWPSAIVSACRRGETGREIEIASVCKTFVYYITDSYNYNTVFLHSDHFAFKIENVLKDYF
jgi:hypothetical protein